MLKKLSVICVALIGMFCFTGCGKNKIHIADYIIEERETLFTANDDLYNVSLCSGKRELNYNLDGVVNNLTDFAILSISRNNNKNMANDTYAYIVTVNAENFTGFLTKSEIDNTYCSDLEIAIPADAVINVKISFTGYTFDKDLTNTSNSFAVDKDTALNIANEELCENVENLIKNKSNIEVVTKILKDYSSVELKNYYWYVGIVASNGETLGILIDSNTGNIIAKKV